MEGTRTAALLLLLGMASCSPKPSSKEVALQQRIDALEARIHTLELDRALMEKSAYGRYPNLKAEAEAAGKLAAQKAQFTALESLPAEKRVGALIGLGLATPNLRDLCRQKMEVDLAIAGQETSLRSAHPKMLALQEERNRLQKAIDVETADLMSGLKTQLDISTRWVAAMKHPSQP